MRGLILSGLMVVAIVTGFIVGLVNASAGLMIVTFCAAPFVFFVLGFSASTVIRGRKPVFLDERQRKALSQMEVQQRQSRLQSVQQQRATNE